MFITKSYSRIQDPAYCLCIDDGIKMLRDFNKHQQLSFICLAGFFMVYWIAFVFNTD